MADSVHLLSTYYRAIRMGQDKMMIETIEKISWQLLTSFTTFLGFISLADTELIPVQNGDFGLHRDHVGMVFNHWWSVSFLYLTSSLKLRKNYLE